MPVQSSSRIAGPLDAELLRRLAQRFGRETVKAVEDTHRRRGLRGRRRARAICSGIGPACDRYHGHAPPAARPQPDAGRWHTFCIAWPGSALAAAVRRCIQLGNPVLVLWRRHRPSAHWPVGAADGRRRPVACRPRCSIRGHRRHWRAGRVGLNAVAETTQSGPTRPMHGLSQRYVNRINGCLDCRPHLRPSVRVPAAVHGRPVSDSPGMG